MPIINSYADVLRHWERLLTSVLEDAGLLPSVEFHRAALERHLLATKAVKARQDVHTAGKQEATQELRAMIAQGREIAIRLRAAIKADMGPRTERLVHFGMAPIRKRPRKVKPAEVEVPEAPKPAA